MAKGGGGASPAPPRGQVYLPEWRRLYDRLLKMLREEHALAEELAIERAHLAAELELQRIGRRGREEIFQARIQQVGGDRPLGFFFLVRSPKPLTLARVFAFFLSLQILRAEELRKRVEKAEREVLIGGKDLESRCYQKLVGKERFVAALSRLLFDGTGGTCLVVSTGTVFGGSRLPDPACSKLTPFCV